MLAENKYVYIYLVYVFSYYFLESIYMFEFTFFSFVLLFYFYFVFKNNMKQFTVDTIYKERLCSLHNGLGTSPMLYSPVAPPG